VQDCLDENGNPNRDRGGDCRSGLLCEIGRDQFYDLLDFFSDLISAIAAGYLKK
jgi:hypothetical protein